MPGGMNDERLWGRCNQILEQLVPSDYSRRSWKHTKHSPSESRISIAILMFSLSRAEIRSPCSVPTLTDVIKVLDERDTEGKREYESWVKARNPAREESQSSKNRPSAVV